MTLSGHSKYRLQRSGSANKPGQFGSIPALSCRSCGLNAPFAELVRLSRTSIAEMQYRSIVGRNSSDVDVGRAPSSSKSWKRESYGAGLDRFRSKPHPKAPAVMREAEENWGGRRR
jgi:hypothetical protein